MVACTPGTNSFESVGRGNDVIRLSGAYLYKLAAALSPLHQIANDAPKGDTYTKVAEAIQELDTLLGQDLIRLPATYGPATVLRAHLDQVRNTLVTDIAKGPEEWEKPIAVLAGYNIRQQIGNFEPVLLAELQIADLYVVTRRGGYNTTDLAENGAVIFPPDLPEKVPDAVDDAKQAGRCIAFNLPTAAAFHMHRANEAVLHRYYAAVAPKKAPPVNKPMEVWIKALEDEPNHDKKVVSALRDLKDLHRNPVLHPQQSLDDVNDAIALAAAVYGAMLHMLKAIPMPEINTLPNP